MKLLYLILPLLLISCSYMPEPLDNPKYHTLVKSVVMVCGVMSGYTIEIKNLEPLKRTVNSQTTDTHPRQIKMSVKTMTRHK